MLQATVCDGVVLDAVSFGEDCLRPAEVDVGRSNVADALVVAVRIVVSDKEADLLLKIARISFSTCSASTLPAPDFCFIFAPCGYDEPEILPP